MAKSGMPALDSTTLLIIVVIVVVIIFVVYFFNKERESFGNCPEGFTDLQKCSAIKCNQDNVGKECKSMDNSKKRCVSVNNGASYSFVSI